MILKTWALIKAFLWEYYLESLLKSENMCQHQIEWRNGKLNNDTWYGNVNVNINTCTQ